MASLKLDHVTVDFAIYGAQKTFRGALRSATGGLIKREGTNSKRVFVRALSDVSFELRDGDRIGLVGHNGAGKSTLLRVCAGVFEPTQGHVSIEGKVSPLFNIAPGLEMDDTGYENIKTCGLFLGMSSTEIERKLPDIMEFTELGDFLNLPVRTYSAGMLTRLGFAIATAIDPEILVLDEGLGAGDARFADKAKRRVDAMVERASILVFASHSDALVRAMCNKAILLQSGQMIEVGAVDEVLEAYSRLTHAPA